MYIGLKKNKEKNTNQFFKREQSNIHNQMLF